MGFRIELWGDYACFTRPEMKVERVSYDVITPSAARGILDAIYYHPGMVWRIDRIFVCNPIEYMSIRRNEVGKTASIGSMRQYAEGRSYNLDSQYISAAQERQQRTTMLLKNVRYIVDAHIEFLNKRTDHELGKALAIISDRLQHGRCYHTPCFGLREYPACFRLYPDNAPLPECPAELKGEKDLGWMLYDMDFSPTNIQPMFYRPKMVDGMIILPTYNNVKEGATS